MDDPKRRKPDISLARSALGWEPKIKLEKGIEATVAYFDDVLTFDRAVAEGEAAVRRQSPPRLQVV
jgi:dTDP-D-glucose 4,6-dehydratase